jgi:uncharacterized protein YndB with AHSA1/START domain
MEAAKIAERPSLSLTRKYPASPEKVWRAWTDPQALKLWWGPGKHEIVSRADLDVRTGGSFRIVFGGPAGTDHDVRGAYKEVVPNRKLVFTWTWPNSTPDRESLVTVELRPVAGGTELAFRHEGFFDEAVRDSHRDGWSEAFEKLDNVFQD